MKYINFMLLMFVLITPLKVFAGDGMANAGIMDTDSVEDPLSAYYDLRDRSSYIQVTVDGNGSGPQCSDTNRSIHVQIFQHDRDCDELNFFDTLTPNDTVVYDLDNIIKNNGAAAPINLAEDSYGYVVVSDVTDDDEDCLLGNFRIIDDSGFEYRTNMVVEGDEAQIDIGSGTIIANFNTVDGAMYADVVGYGYTEDDEDSTILNLDNGFSFDIFIFDMNEEPLSCDRRNFACGKIMNYGINEDYKASRGSDLLCPGGGLANPDGGFISFQNGSNDAGTPIGDDASSDDVFVNFIGINNNDGTGSMDTWIYVEGFEFIDDN